MLEIPQICKKALWREEMSAADDDVPFGVDFGDFVTHAHLGISDAADDEDN